MVQEICTGKTGHAEVVQITFDPMTISFKELLEVFFIIHDPTTLNRQGADVGTQYRSVIFYHTKEQEKVARDMIAKIDLEKYCRVVITPKLASFRKKFFDKLKKDDAV